MKRHRWFSMAQYRLTSGDPEADRSLVDSNRPELSISRHRGIGRAYPFDCFVKIRAKLADGRRKYFEARCHLEPADRVQLSKLLNELKKSEFVSTDWVKLRNELVEKYSKELDALEIGLVRKADEWVQLQSSEICLMPMIEHIVTGTFPTNMVKHLHSIDAKFVWVRSSQCPSESSETLAAFVLSKEDDETLVRLDQYRRVPGTMAHGSSIYVLVTPESRVKLDTKLVELGRARVKRALCG
jgi:hypothetical protein